MSTPLDVPSLLRGAHLDDLGMPRRVPAAEMERWAADTVEAAQVPAGSHLSFTGDAEMVEFDVTITEEWALATPITQTLFSVYCKGRCNVIPVDELGRTRVRIPLPDRAEQDRVEIYLPERRRITIHDVVAHAGSIGPTTPGPRWVAYGDSITQGWTSSEPGAAWSSVAARSTGADLLNLGFAGAARGELPLAAYIATLPADVISLSWGTNCWAQIEMDETYIAELMRLFVRTIRRGHPSTPLLVTTPIERPDAESALNGAGSTLADLRRALELSVTTMQHSDSNLHLLPGADVVPIEHLRDGIHPDDVGHQLLGLAVAERLRPLLPVPVR